MLDSFDKEPIHLIGLIQHHGVLIVSKANAANQTIDFISENTAATLGIDAEKLLGQPLDALIALHSLKMIEKALTLPLHNAHTCYDLKIHSPLISSAQASFHIHNELLLIELQPFLDSKCTSSGFDISDKDAIVEFTAMMLRAYNFDQLATSLVSFFFEKLNYDRVMVYKFDEDGHAEVFAEAKKSHLEPLLGLHYPASDIPEFSRILYVHNRCQIITDINSKSVPIKAFTKDKSNYDLDLRYSNLRSVSSIHTEHLSYMGVHASLAMSIVKDNKLFGLLIMHHYQPRYCGLRTREVINQLSFICSDYLKLLQSVEETADVERSQDIHNLMNMYLFDNDVNIDYQQVAETLLQIFKGDGICVYVNGEQIFSSALVHKSILSVMQDVGRSFLPYSNIFYSSNLAKDRPDIFASDKRVCGLLLINLPTDKQSFIAIFRYEKAEMFRWASRKQEYSEVADGYLHPRQSFKEWREYSKNQSQPWIDQDIFNAENIRSIFTRYLFRLNERYLVKKMSFDSLTELPNRNFITNKIEQLLSQRFDIGMLIIDCDRFKSINDSLGHDVGDKVLREVAKRLKELEVPGSVVARLGGDEFAMLVQSKDRVKIEKMAIDIVAAFAMPISFERFNFQLPVSVGIALSYDQVTCSSLMRAADMAMYDAKNNRGNTYRFVNDELLRKVDERLALEQNIYLAIDSNEIINYYQPIAETKTNSFYGVEVLCRWLKTNGETILPIHFLPVAEKTGVIIPIGIQIIDQALNDLQIFHKKNPNLFMSLNFSPLQLLDNRTVNYLIDEIHKRSLDANNIWIELTEESYIEDELTLIGILNKIKAAGIKIALDDFGSGYSSMRYLTVLPIDVVKFDKTLIDNVYTDVRSLDLLKACKKFADICQLITVAEGIETLHQKKCVSDVGINFQQGYLFGKPVNFDTTLELLG